MLPVSAKGIAASSWLARSNMFGVSLRQLLGNPRELCCELTVDGSRVGFHLATAGIDCRVSHNLGLAYEAQLLDSLCDLRTEGPVVSGVQSHDNPLVSAGQLEGLAHQTDGNFRGVSQLATDDSTSDRQSHFVGVLFPVLLPSLARLRDGLGCAA